mmetsp:Transcript_25693/g.64751  ORF Transcript_25693/g.64751 Transcript_25693/m.64751 type:complete len:800 (+) Transcript_25693:2992-5391(+)|eukprot:CAMPEP_0178991024 /NCGR_PEP_ID=MMETSP0795-20121207/5290_1 /TAXON_ID=88552 /ORGANISM="Amoebophrya sp., Strain Ameob2" /LENGTH=799 /DNA_ID=CAMNT_0020682671 /DNA_START=100 /DNA_END=2499 /DNA_ORIENTATION=-
MTRAGAGAGRWERVRAAVLPELGDVLLLRENDEPPVPPDDEYPPLPPEKGGPRVVPWVPAGSLEGTRGAGTKNKDVDELGLASSFNPASRGPLKTKTRPAGGRSPLRGSAGETNDNKVGRRGTISGKAQPQAKRNSRGGSPSTTGKNVEKTDKPKRKRDAGGVSWRGMHNWSVLKETLIEDGVLAHQSDRRMLVYLRSHVNDHGHDLEDFDVRELVLPFLRAFFPGVKFRYVQPRSRAHVSAGKARSLVLGLGEKEKPDVCVTSDGRKVNLSKMESVERAVSDELTVLEHGGGSARSAADEQEHIEVGPAPGRVVGPSPLRPAAPASQERSTAPRSRSGSPSGAPPTEGRKALKLKLSGGGRSAETGKAGGKTMTTPATTTSTSSTSSRNRVVVSSTAPGGGSSFLASRKGEGRGEVKKGVTPSLILHLRHHAVAPRHLHAKLRRRQSGPAHGHVGHSITAASGQHPSSLFHELHEHPHAPGWDGHCHGFEHDRHHFVSSSHHDLLHAGAHPSDFRPASDGTSSQQHETHLRAMKFAHLCLHAHATIPRPFKRIAEDIDEATAKFYRLEKIPKSHLLTRHMLDVDREKHKGGKLAALFLAEMGRLVRLIARECFGIAHTERIYKVLEEADGLEADEAKNFSTRNRRAGLLEYRCMLDPHPRSSSARHHQHHHHGYAHHDHSAREPSHVHHGLSSSKTSGKMGSRPLHPHGTTPQEQESLLQFVQEERNAQLLCPACLARLVFALEIGGQQGLEERAQTLGNFLQQTALAVLEPVVGTLSKEHWQQHVAVRMRKFIRSQN